jgi:hypothetical protein
VDWSRIGLDLWRVWPLFRVGEVGDFEGDAEIAFRVEVSDADAAIFAAEDEVVAALGLRCQDFVEVPNGDRDVVDAFAILGEEAGEEAIVVERVDEFPIDPADHGSGDAGGARDRPTVLVLMLEGVGVMSVIVQGPIP